MQFKKKFKSGGLFCVRDRSGKPDGMGISRHAINILIIKDNSH